MAVKSWTVPVDSEGVVSLPEELIKVLGWDKNTLLEWDYTPEGQITLKAVNDADLDKVSPE